jgi:hypothetical protein
MSGIVKAIGKVFSPISMILPKKIGNVVRKVAMGALMVGAVVMTGGAALGLLPSLGTMVGGLGLSAGLTSVLTGAISTGAVGAVGGLITGGLKGATKGFLIGAAAGGAMGGLGLIGPNGLLGGGAKAAGGIADIAKAGGQAAATTGTSIAPAASSSLPAAKSVVGAALGGAKTATAAVSGGPLGFLNANPLLASQLLSGVSAAFAPNEYKQKYTAEEQAAQQQGYYAYGGGDSNGKKKGGMIPGVYSGQANPFGTPVYPDPPPRPPAFAYQLPEKRFHWDAATNSVIERRA